MSQKEVQTACHEYRSKIVRERLNSIKDDKVQTACHEYRGKINCCSKRIIKT